MKIGVLDIQGSVEEHFEALGRLGKSLPGQTFEPVLVKKAGDFTGIDGLVIPGGESTTISKLIRLYGLDREIKALAERGGRIFGTCAGAILLSSKIIGNKGDVAPLGLIDIDIERNAYGRQVESFETEIEVVGGGVQGSGARGDKRVAMVPAVFIRAPIITRVGKECEVLASYEGKPVLVRQGGVAVATFHPEMGNGTEVYEAVFS